jgi:ATP-dependent Lon protease
MDDLDKKLNAAYPGRVVRKDLLHRIKKGTNVPSFVLEFLLARYCASDDPDEIEAGIHAVFETLLKNYVRPDESNKAQSLVQQKGKHKFIDKIHVAYKEKEKRHWAEMENFNSRRIAIPDKFYRDNDRLLEGGIWAEVTLAHNDIEDDDYAFYVEDLRPVQLSRFDYDEYVAGRKHFSRDEWLDVLMRSCGLEPSKMTQRLKLHYLSRLFCFVEANFNFIELGPRGTGKSFAYSELTPYATLVSQASTPTLFYNLARRKVGLVGYWDTVAFDEVGRVKLKDKDTVEVMKNYMANGRFSRGVEVVANASFAFVGNIDFSIEQLVNSTQFDLLVPLPPEFDLAVIDRFYYYMPGWEIPKNSSGYLTDRYGFITDYLAEAFHHLAKQSRYDFVTKHCKFGRSIQGRDEIAAKKTLSAIIKLLHPVGEPTRSELEEYMAYALEGRRRIKEQLNKRKADDEYEAIDLSYFNEEGKEVVVWCPESRNAAATQNPARRKLPGSPDEGNTQEKPAKVIEEKEAERPEAPKEDQPPPPQRDEPKLTEQHYTIFYGEIGYTYERILGDYLKGATKIQVKDPYIRAKHQIVNWVRFCEMIVRAGNIREIHLHTGCDNELQKKEAEENFLTIAVSLKEHDVIFKHSFDDKIHDREIQLDNGWVVKIGRGFDIYQKPDDWFSIGANDLALRPCLETMVDIYQVKSMDTNM